MSIRQSMFLRTNKAATVNEAAKLSKASLQKKRKRDSAEKAIPVEVLPDLVTPLVGTPAVDVSAADTVPAASQVQASHPLGTEAGSERVAEGTSRPVDVGEGGSFDAGPSSPHDLEVMSDPSSRSSKGKEKVFVVEPRLPSQDRPMTVEDSALQSPEVARALGTSLTSPKDQGLLNRLSSSELVGMGYRHLIGVGTVFLCFYLVLCFYCILTLFSLCRLFSISPSSTSGGRRSWRIIRSLMWPGKKSWKF